MLVQEYYGFHQELTRKGIIFSFSGYVSEGILFALGQALKQKMALEDTDANVTRRVFSVFVEQVQNIIRYSANRVEGEVGQKVELSSGMIVVGRDDTRFYVVCGNVVDRSDLGMLNERLGALAAMDKDALKAHYRAKLKEPSEEQSKGASIGLIEIARRASEPLKFGFMDIDEDHAFFCLRAHI